MGKLTAGMIRRIKREFSAEKPTIWVGKGQVSEDIVKEIEKQLKTRGIVKIKVLRTALKEARTVDIAAKISRRTEAELVEVRGHTFILYKQRRKTAGK